MLCTILEETVVAGGTCPGHKGMNVAELPVIHVFKEKDGVGVGT